MPSPKELLKIAAPNIGLVMLIAACTIAQAAWTLWAMRHPAAERPSLAAAAPERRPQPPADDVGPARFTSVQVPHCPGSVTGDETCSEGVSCSSVKPAGHKLILRSYRVAAGEQGPVLVCEWAEDR